MKFDVALKDVKVGDTAGPLERTDRMYPCCTCRKNTGWRTGVGPDCPGVPVCSDECLDAMNDFKNSDDVSSGPTLAKG